MLLGRSNRARDEGAGQERPRGVVNEDNIGRGGPQCLKPGTYRCLPGGAAEDRRPQRIEPAASGAKRLRVIWMNDRLHRVDLFMSEKGH